MNDANGYEIDLRKRGLSLCTHCKLVMSEGWYGDGDYACSDHCLDAQQWQVYDASIPGHTADGAAWGVLTILTSFNCKLLEAPENETLFDCVYWTDWEGDESDEESIERLMQAPYSFTIGDLHAQGAHDDEHFGPDPACNQCPQLDQWAVRK